MSKTPKIILASQSPRRHEILAKMGVEFEPIPSQFDEHLDDSRDVHEVIKELALGKALDIAQKHPEAYAIGSDTIVTIHGKQLEKPIDSNEARSFLESFAGQQTPVLNGIALVNLSKGIQIVKSDWSTVYFKPNSDEIQAAREKYLASNDWKDKAAGYGIQSGAAPLIDYIEGDYDTIMGLSSRLLSEILKEIGITSSILAEEAPVPQHSKK